ncbi:2-oxoglutarate ferredoxin oxidoreductase subunit gamma [Desulfotomaculum arcticum]|uniref:2-oxoglutarate ferredoxin oxidoreductase subunit gamma n=1 Tax=Desulfotruncus arcticus DSM 17038 TaxID=1121424 RepID=A0A1I2Q7Z9_9FIRM|nr:2-oxoacid:acceptor oxidoreductase family protein [Desulfotruncus arcticus]SFG21751.1 2-oxoglutarate ferredoxin oxidoreductase subunit gamma [Desulfotomaculum arcticum] [Desulfotruncus arcticus DSM 17038]
MADRNELRLSGTGGQGLILAGIIMADAAIRDGRNSIQSQSYGPEARGGASRSEVIIGDDEIDYPKVSKPDVLLVMSQEACDKFATDFERDGVMIVDTTYVHTLPDVEGVIYKLPISMTARDEIGKEMVANVVALGVIARITGVVSREALTEALLSRIPKGTEDLNRKALEAGWSLVEKELH